jgi:glycosyltransferase involved in cell wall biosynthesis
VNKKEKISVIMNCHNSTDFLDLAIESVINQSYSNIEIVFIDNSSDPLVFDIISKYFSETVKYVYLDNLVPLGEARNIGIHTSTGDFITFLDCDDLWESSRIEKMLEIALETKSNFLTSETKQISLTGEIKDIYHSFSKQHYSFYECIYNFNILILSVLIKKDFIVNNQIFFDKNLQLLEDYDFFLRLCKIEPPFYISTVYNYYRHHPKMTSILKEELFHYEYKYLANKYILLGIFKLPEDLHLYDNINFKADFCLYRSLLRKNKRFAAFQNMKKYFFKGFRGMGLTFISFLGFQFFSKIYKVIYKRDQF